MAEKKILVTGGCGFIGTNLVRHLVAAYPNYQIINLDALTYAGRRENTADLEKLPNYRFVRGRIEERGLVNELMSGVEVVFHLAAESHVDRSIEDAGVFVRTNIEGTLSLLEAAKNHNVSRFIHVSTDEVYGSLGATGRFTEESPIRPSSPYSASKAGSDLLALSYHHTHGVPVVVTRCSNNYGPYQFPEKMLPLFITNLLEDIAVPVYGDGMNVRDWIHVHDHCRALVTVWQRGVAGEVYNIGSDNEWTNIDLTHELLKLMKRSETMLRYVKDRAGHDRRYAIDNSKISGRLGWKPETEFGKGLKETIQWYREHDAWWRAIKLNNPEYRAFCQRLYGHTMDAKTGVIEKPVKSAPLTGTVSADDGVAESQGHS